MKLTAASKTNRPWPFLHFQQPSERIPDEASQPTGLQCRRNPAGIPPKFAQFAPWNPILAHGVHQSDLTRTKARPIWRQISVHILQNEQLQQTHSVPNHRRSNTSWRTRRNTISGRNNNNGQAVYRHRFTWSRTCLKAFRALPDQKGMKPSCLKKYIWIWVAA